MHNFKLVNYDTDSITICKQDGSEFSEQEQKELLNELNEQFDELINFEHDGYFPVVIVLKAKNYILYDGKTIKTKGSALKDSKKEEALKCFMNDIIKTIINKEFEYEKIYRDYVKEALNVKDIKRWCSKKTITSKVLEPQRTNEQKILDALDNVEFQEGDKVWLYFKSDGSLGVAEKFDGEYDKLRLVKKLHETAKVFKKILPVENLFPNLTLKKNKDLLESFKSIS
jgi:hypothetical protein